MLSESKLASLVESGRELVRDCESNGTLEGWPAFLDKAWTHASEMDLEDTHPLISGTEEDLAIGAFLGGAIGERFRILTA